MKKIFNFQRIARINQAGVTLMELMIVIAIMAILSVGFYINIKNSLPQQIDEDTLKLFSNLRTLRNMVISRTVHTFSGQTIAQYPAGGYGIQFDDSGAQPLYFIFADKAGEGGYQAVRGDEIVGQTMVLNSAFELANNFNDNQRKFYFTLINERNADTDMTADTDEKYVVRLRWLGAGYPNNGYESRIRLGEKSLDGTVVANFGATYHEYIPGPPPKGGEDDGPPPDVDF